MKIISKYKDYYDYLSGVCGIDPLITYVRSGTPLKDNQTFYETFVDAGDKVPAKHALQAVGPVHSSLWNGVRLHGSSHGSLIAFELVIGNSMIYFEIDRYMEGEKVVNDIKFLLYDTLPYPRESNAPMYIAWQTPRITYRGKYYHEFGWRSEHDNIVENPILDGSFIPSMLDPRFVWEKVSEYIGLQKVVPITEPTDKEKIVQHGFDTRTSFRNIK